MYYFVWDVVIVLVLFMVRVVCVVGLGDFLCLVWCGIDVLVFEFLVKIVIELNVILGFGGFWEILNCLVNWNVNF